MISIDEAARKHHLERSPLWVVTRLYEAARLDRVSLHRITNLLALHRERAGTDFVDAAQFFGRSDGSAPVPILDMRRALWLRSRPISETLRL